MFTLPFRTLDDVLAATPMAHARPVLDGTTRRLTPHDPMPRVAS
jgi:hypothetical protein